MSKESKPLGVWMIRFTGLWEGVSLQAATSKLAAIKAVENNYPRTVAFRVEKIKGLSFQGKPQTVYSYAISGDL